MKQFLFLLLICGTTTVFAQKKTDFSGEFLINTEKTTFGPVPQGNMPKILKVSQEKDKISITRTAVDGAVQSPEILTYDGTVLKRTLGEWKATSQLKWADDGKTFTNDKSSMNMAGEVAVNVKETWELIDGGKTLKLTRDFDQVAGNAMKYSITGYFDKK